MNTNHLIFFLLLIYTLVGCGGESPSVNDEVGEETTAISLSARQHEAAGIALGRIERKALKNGIQLNGVVDVPPQNMIVVSPAIGGFVRSIHVREGEEVRKGQLLVTLENIAYIELQQEYLKSRSELDYADQEYERQKELANENINAAKTLQKARADFESLRSTVNGLEAKLRLLGISPADLKNRDIQSRVRLYAPSGGFISEVDVSTGQFFNSAEPILRIVDLSHLHILLHVFEKDIDRLRVGQEVVFRAISGESQFGAEVYLIGKELTPERTIRVHCHPTGDIATLVPGIYVTATVVTDAAEADVLPSAAIVRYGGTEMIFISREADNRFEAIEVTTGRSDGAFVEVKWPVHIDRNTPVVVSGAAALLGILKNTGGED